MDRVLDGRLGARRAEDPGAAVEVGKGVAADRAVVGGARDLRRAVLLPLHIRLRVGQVELTAARLGKGGRGVRRRARDAPLVVDVPLIEGRRREEKGGGIGISGREWYWLVVCLANHLPRQRRTMGSEQCAGHTHRAHTAHKRSE